MHELMSAELAPAPYLVGFYFLSFTVLCVFLVVNLFVSVVVVAVQKNEEEAWAYKQANDTGDHGTNEPSDSFSKASLAQSHLPGPWVIQSWTGATWTGIC